jgi:Tat protein translocase TatC
LHLPEDLKVLNYTEGFFTYLKVSFVAGIFIASPVVIYELWKFVAEGLYPNERRYVYYFAPASLGLFLCGMLFGFYVMIPFGLRFLLAMGGDIATPLIRLNEYISLLVVLTLVLGIVFELPLVMLFLVKIGLVTPQQYREQWRYAYFAMVVLAAIITPTGDPINLSIVSVPMIGLYEVGILLCRPSLKHFLSIVGVSVGILGGVFGIYYYYSLKPNRLGVAEASTGGPLKYRATSSGEFRDLPKGSSIITGMTVRTEGARSKIDVGKGAQMRLNYDTEVHADSVNRISLIHGEVLLAMSKEREAMTIATPDGEVEAREATVDVQTGQEGTRAIAVKGEAVAVVDGIRRTVAEGHSLTFKRGGEPTDVKRATRWAEF